MNPNNAAQAADTNPLSDEYVNAVIQQHGYDSPECVIARLHQWIGLHGGENGVTLLMYEAHKALSKLRAPVADERAVANAQAAFEAWSEGTNQGYDLTRMNSGKLATYESDLTEHAWRGYCHAALASAPVAGEAKNYPGDNVAERLDKMADDQPPGSQAQSDLYAAATIWRKHVAHHAAPQPSTPDFADAYEGAREDLAIWKRRALEAERDLRAERETSSRLVAALNAENGPTHMGEPAPQASEAVRDAEAWLIEWKPGDGNTWVEADANEVRAREKAQRVGGTVTPMVRVALSAQPGAEQLSNPKQFPLTAADERTAFEATYQADYDDPGAACEREHFGKGYRACLAAQSAKEQGESDA